MNEQHRLDVSHASAAYLLECLPAILSLPAPEAFERLREHIETAIMAYSDCLVGWVPTSNNN